MFDGASKYLVTQGVLGIAVLVLSFVIVYIYKESIKKDKIIYDLQEARRVDYKETTKQVTDVLQNNTQAVSVLTAKIVSERDR